MFELFNLDIFLYFYLEINSLKMATNIDPS